MKKIAILLGLISCLISCEKDNSKEKNEQKENSAYITDVFEYVYGVGQHTNMITEKTSDNFIGNTPNYVLLGGWGGYIIAGFDHNIQNKDGYDFAIICKGSVCPEPAVIYVMEDTNNDGKPNDTWYQIKGSEYENSIHNYAVTYHYNGKDKNITWTDNQGNEGELVPGYGNTTSDTWWPYGELTEKTFTGERLPDAYFKNEETGIWDTDEKMFRYGYAENIKGSDYDKELYGNMIDISDAIDTNGENVDIQHIRFIKVQTSVFQQADWLNEISTEISGAKEL